MRWAGRTALALLVAVFAWPNAGTADQGPTVPEVTCPDSEFISGRLITDICWSCVFPVRIASLTIGGGDVPPGAVDDPLCLCFDNHGIPEPGITMSFWEPSRAVELVRFPGCSMALGGVVLPLGDWRSLGTEGDHVFDDSDLVYYHYHTYAFPLLSMLELFTNRNCSDGYLDLDLIMLSELDPTWNNPELAFFQHPEAAYVANPIAQAACAVDAAAATAGFPLDEMFWCAGAWSALYPFSGNEFAEGSFAQNTSLLMARSLAVSHRRGLSWRTKGSDTLCRPTIDPLFPKTQYKASMFFPVAEAEDNHVIGESDWTWGLHRHIPGFGEDALYVVWRWQDCCLR